MKGYTFVSILVGLVLSITGLVYNSNLKHKLLLVSIATFLSLLLVCAFSFGTEIKSFFIKFRVKRAVNQINTNDSNINSVTVKRRFKFAQRNGTRLSASDSRMAAP